MNETFDDIVEKMDKIFGCNSIIKANKIFNPIKTNNKCCLNS